jgi:hypothetical protein
VRGILDGDVSTSVCVWQRTYCGGTRNHEESYPELDTVAHIPHPDSALFGDIGASRKSWQHETL